MHIRSHALQPLKEYTKYPPIVTDRRVPLQVTRAGV